MKDIKSCKDKQVESRNIAIKVIAGWCKLESKKLNQQVDRIRNHAGYNDPIFKEFIKVYEGILLCHEEDWRIAARKFLLEVTDDDLREGSPGDPSDYGDST